MWSHDSFSFPVFLTSHCIIQYSHYHRWKLPNFCPQEQHAVICMEENQNLQNEPKFLGTCQQSFVTTKAMSELKNVRFHRPRPGLTMRLPLVCLNTWHTSTRVFTPCDLNKRISLHLYMYLVRTNIPFHIHSQIYLCKNPLHNQRVKGQKNAICL